MISEIIGYSAFAAGFIVTILSFYYAYRFHRMQWSFLFLGLSYFSYATAEWVWYRLDAINMETYVSFADLAYMWYFVFGILHVLVMLTYFQKCGMRTIMVIIAGTIVLVSIYIIFSLGSEMFVYGLFFATLAAFLATSAIMATLGLMRTRMRKSWILFGIAISTASVVDIWYYTQENITGYEYGMFPLMDGLWAFTDILIIVAILVHRREI